MRLRKSLRLNSAGDTIVEVMIVLAVLGLSIGIAYATANRSLLNARQAQESAEATALAQSQVEQLRAMAPNTNADVDHYIYVGGTTSNSYFCINSSGKVVSFASTDIYDYSTYANAATTKDCSLGSTLYHVSIKYDSGAAANDKFTVKVIWDDVLGQGQDSATLIYRVHQDL